MQFGELLVGIVLIAAGSVLGAIARPREGEVRSFLRSDGAQAYYTILVLGLLAVGLANVITAVVPGESLGSFKAIR
jgi:hypothetical protein